MARVQQKVLKFYIKKTLKQIAQVLKGILLESREESNLFKLAIPGIPVILVNLKRDILIVSSSI